MKHILKIDHAHFEAVHTGSKRAEVRYNGDRGFQAGDVAILNETDGPSCVLTGRQVEVLITYVDNFRQAPDWVVFSFQIVD